MFPPVAQGSIICAYGDLIQDQLCVLAGDLPPDGHVDAQVSFHRGGCAPNVLAATAALGAQARFLGHFGADSVSSSLADQLQRGGVRIFGVRRGRGAASLCIKSPDGSTSFILDPADSRSVTPGDIRRWWLKDAAVLHLNSYHLYAEGSADAFWKIVGLAQEASIPISLDVSSTSDLEEYGVNRYREALTRIRPAVLMANEPEGEALGLEGKFPEGVAVTLFHRGPRPTKVAMESGDNWEVPVPECDNVVDTVGAGDVFAGGFLVGWTQQRSLRGAVELAHEVAVASIQHLGVEVERERSGNLSEVI